ncbi:DUF1588 domain-containing protein [Lentisphaera profundi]|uniref:DUF1588 domain-containing protein n=1 Tax=Lentisphaera profundi TaxID=1658616 RepID=A0ABY7VYB2_9BACT|nr:DUF1588 domain-containing protein [Lentisphaera profundi]WDE99243.1 DUF1588 domain-containing protein [Lentisphaera profundi]
MLKQLLLSFIIGLSSFAFGSDQYQESIRPLLDKYCISCHGGKETKGHINLKSINNMEQAYKKHHLWEDVIDLIEDGEMPPEKKKEKGKPAPAPVERPSQKELTTLKNWYTKKFINIKALPAKAKLTRLSTEYYRNSIRTLLGFDLSVNIVGTPETVVENSLIIKILPADPPGESGFSNDTSQSPITNTLWEKYNFIANSAVEELFSKKNKKHLELYSGPIAQKFSKKNAQSLITKFTQRAFKTTACSEHIKKSIQRIIKDLKMNISLIDSCKKELKTVLISPQFLYNGKYSLTKKGLQPVNQYELAQRLSYFLWGTLPDNELLSLASKKHLNQKTILIKQVDRMLNHERSQVFSELFAREWLALDEIKKSSKKWPEVHAKFYQPIHFVDYLIREDRPLMELIDSKVTYANPFLYKFYDQKDALKIKKTRKDRGVEVIVQEHNKITLEHTAHRGGILTMPGILSMYSGHKRTSPILRGVWFLERILGDELGEAPMDVPAIKKQAPGEKLSFREIFEKHRSSPSCMICHHKIDPLGFGLENFDYLGTFRESGKDIDSSGVTPNGDKFEDFAGLKKILLKRYDEDIIHNITEKMYTYGLARSLNATDRPIVNSISTKMIDKDGTYRDLIKDIVTSLAFTHTIVE